MDEARDFGAETEALGDLLAPLGAAACRRPTLFKGWTIDDILGHLAFWNRAEALALADAEAFARLRAEVTGALGSGTLRAHEAAAIRDRGPALRDLWLREARALAAAFDGIDPRRRLPWIGPDMSARSAMTARLMETWAHGQAIHDLLGVGRVETDRVRGICVLGVNTFAWSFRVRGREPPGPMPYLELTAPSGTVWRWGEPDPANRIEGSAVGFAQVVCQTRNVADTDLRVTGPVAADWMANAQCFAGPPETPPPPGFRRRAGA